jgi:hypothetical protein
MARLGVRVGEFAATDGLGTTGYLVARKKVPQPSVKKKI